MLTAKIDLLYIGVVILFALSCISCWDKQSHDIVKPEVPHYTLSGYTVDIDESAITLPNTSISLSGVQLLYDVVFEPIAIESDSNGYFRIEMVYPGNYFLSAKRNGYTVVNENITIGHEDRVYSIELPQFLLNEVYYPIGFPNSIFTWHDGVLWLSGSHKINEDTSVRAILGYSFYEGVWGYDRWIPNLVETIYGLEYGNGSFYVYGDSKITIVSPVDGSIINEIEMEIMNGLYWDGSGFWSTKANYLQYRGQAIATIDNSIGIDSGKLGPLTKAGNYFWSYDRDRDLILKLDVTGNIHTSYRPIDYDSGTWIRVHDMDIENNNRLWVSGTNTESLFVFQIEE